MKPEVVVITGASAGVGRATAREFARKGARIGLIARGRDGLEAAEREVESLGGRGLVLVADVSDAERIDEAASRVEEAFGPIDIWVNNAMDTVVSPFVEMTTAEFKRVTEVTYLGYVYGTSAALKRMIPRDRGVIVQVGSALAYRSIPFQSAYCGAKHAIRGFTDSIRSELLHRKSKVRLTMIQLPAVNTPQFTWCKTRLPRKLQPVPPIYQPEVPARAIVWAAHHPRRELFLGISSIITVWGNKVFPWLGDWYLGKTGWEAQQHNGLVDPNRPHYLWEPLPGDYGAHGEFDDQAHDTSPQFWLSKNRGWLTMLASAVALLLLFPKKLNALTRKTRRI